MLLKNMLYLKNKNWAHFLHAYTDPIIFGETVNLTLLSLAFKCWVSNAVLLVRFPTGFV